VWTLISNNVRSAGTMGKNCSFFMLIIFSEKMWKIDFSFKIFSG